MGLKETFEHQQKVLELQLALAREKFRHHGLRGGAAEAALRAFIETNLPRILSVGTGEVIATKTDEGEKTSRQLDIVVSNELQPFSSPRDEAGLYVIEGVNVAGEVKSILGRSDFPAELSKGRAFKSLRATNLSRLVAVPKPDVWDSYFVHYRPYFIFAFETGQDWRWFLLDTYDYILRTGKIPYDGLFLMDKGIAVLVSPFLKFPFGELAGVPFFHSIPEVGSVMGGVHVYKTSAFLAFFLGWMSTFRGSFFADKSALPHYLESVVNGSMEDIVLAEAKHDTQEQFLSEAKAGLESNPLQYMADYLRTYLAGK